MRACRRAHHWFFCFMTLLLAFVCQGQDAAALQATKNAASDRYTGTFGDPREGRPLTGAERRRLQELALELDEQESAHTQGQPLSKAAQRRLEALGGSYFDGRPGGKQSPPDDPDADEDGWVTVGVDLGSRQFEPA